MLKDAGLTMQDLHFSTLNEAVTTMEGIGNERIDGAMWGTGTLGSILADGKGVHWVATTVRNCQRSTCYPS